MSTIFEVSVAALKRKLLRQQKAVADTEAILAELQEAANRLAKTK